jgi:hypothetical protein
MRGTQKCVVETSQYLICGSADELINNHQIYEVVWVVGTKLKINIYSLYSETVKPKGSWGE